MVRVNYGSKYRVNAESHYDLLPVRENMNKKI